MGLPKRRHSQSRGRKRRTHYRVTPPPVAVCSNCNAAILPHRVCPVCGHYKGQQVHAVEEA